MIARLRQQDSFSPCIRLIPYHQPFLAGVAEALLAAAPDIRDLTGYTFLLPQPLTAPALRQALLAASGETALLGPRITSLRQWVMAQAPLVDQLSDQAAELMLVEALQDHLGLFGNDNPWRIAEALRQLFTELTQQHVSLPDSLDDWTARLAQAYGTQNLSLQREARIVHQLWQAWNEQLAASQHLDQASAYQQALAQTLSQPHEPLILLGMQSFTAPERDWLRHKLANGQLSWFIQAPASRGRAEQAIEPLLALADVKAEPASSDIGACLAAVFPDDDSDMRQRALQLAARFDRSPLRERYRCFSADNPEQEVRAIDLQVRQWLLADKTCIGIITEDRRLARRVRALLERAGIELQDSGGWALSTTTAAAVLERWLECIEEDFAHLPFLDLLKSPLLLPETDREQHLHAVYRLEQDIILHENISRGLNRYQQHLDYRLRRLNAEESSSYDSLRDLLELIAAAATSLQALRHTSALPADYLAALQQSLISLGIWQSWQQDAAGLRLISLWDSLHAAAQRQTLMLDWQGFRVWLGGNIERTTFRPAQTGGPVQLLTLEQSQGQHFDALIIGGCDAEHLPSKPGVSPFFNDSVRHELGLPTWQQDYQLQLYHFRRVLEAAPDILFTWHREDQGDPVLPSPWLDALLTLHEISFASRLEDQALHALLKQPVDVQPPHCAPLPAIPQQPRPRLPMALQPLAESPSSHQQLIDCPYQYFAAQGLRLQPPEEIRDALAKSDYGERVHRCLEAFHSDVKELPGPFTHAVTEQNRPSAIDMLTAIAHAEFAKDLEDNFQHRGWLKRWLKKIPQYIDWQITHQQQWQVKRTEQRLEQQLSPVLTVKGRLDRIDSDRDALAIIDYKTGASAKRDEVVAGEAVQLPFYALLSEQPVAEVSYLKLDDEPLRDGARLTDDELAALTAATRERLLNTHAAIAANAPLPAWGDPNSCRYCDMRGLCRKDIWDE